MSEPGDPTELAGMAEMGTESITAWSLDDDNDDYLAPRGGLSPRVITALAVAASLFVAGAAVFGYPRQRQSTADAIAAAAQFRGSPSTVIPAAQFRSSPGTVISADTVADPGSAVTHHVDPDATGEAAGSGASPAAQRRDDRIGVD